MSSPTVYDYTDPFERAAREQVLNVTADQGVPDSAINLAVRLQTTRLRNRTVNNILRAIREQEEDQ